MKQYKEIENGIEYEVFELTMPELYYQIREIEKIEYAKVVRQYDDHKDVFYFHKGEAHNKFGPCVVTILENGESFPICYYFDGDRLTDEEWKVYHRTKVIDEVLKKYEKYEKIRKKKEETNN
jgi:hypothetical protein